MDCIFAEAVEHLLATIFLQFAKSIGGTSAKTWQLRLCCDPSFWTEVMAMFGACQPI